MHSQTESAPPIRSGFLILPPLHINTRADPWLPNETHMTIYVPQTIWKWHIVCSPSHSLAPSLGCSSWINAVKGLSNSSPLYYNPIGMQVRPHHLKGVKIKHILYKNYIHKTYKGICCSTLTSVPDLGNWSWSLLTCSSRLASLMGVNLFLAEIWQDLIFLCRYEEEQPNILAMALIVKPWLKSSSICPLVMSRVGLPHLPKICK